MLYLFRTNTSIDKKENFESNDPSSEQMNDKAECITAEKKKIVKGRRLNQNNMSSFTECLANYN